MGLGISYQVLPSEIYKVTGQWQADTKKNLLSPISPPGLILSAGFSQAVQIRFAAEPYVSPREDIFCGAEEELEVPAPGTGSWGGQVERSEEGGGRVVPLHNQLPGRSSQLVSFLAFPHALISVVLFGDVSCLVVRHGVRSVVLGGRQRSQSSIRPC